MPIVKVQKPWFSSKVDAPFFVYAEHHKDARFVSAAELPNNVKGAMRRSYREYFEAELVNDSWKIGKHAEQQEW